MKLENMGQIIDQAATMEGTRVDLITELVEGLRYYLEVKTPTPKTRMIVEVSYREWDGRKTKSSIPWQWFKRGYTDKPLAAWWSINTYYSDEKNNCTGSFNPCIRLHESGGRHVVNFDWLLEPTADNLASILREVQHMMERGEKIKK